MIRIIGGQMRGRKLKVPPGKQVRPTPDRVREALFNMLDQQVDWNQLTVLDLYAGSGALGLEALSRGARRAVFVDVSQRPLETVRQNLVACGIESEKAELMRDRAEIWIKRFSNPENICLVLLDPPYRMNHYSLILPLLSTLPAIPQYSWIVVESPKEMTITIPDSLHPIRQRTYGTVSIDLLQKQ